MRGSQPKPDKSVIGDSRLTFHTREGFLERRIVRRRIRNRLERNAQAWRRHRFGRNADPWFGFGAGSKNEGRADAGIFRSACVFDDVPEVFLPRRRASVIRIALAKAAKVGTPLVDSSIAAAYAVGELACALPSAMGLQRIVDARHDGAHSVLVVAVAAPWRPWKEDGRAVSEGEANAVA